jgi:6-phosphogluconolactonase (cycloisomerase 2 family)
MWRNLARSVRVAVLLAAVVALAGVTAAAWDGGFGHFDRPGAVYVLTNQPTGNSVMVYARKTDGRLFFYRRFFTGGNGMGTGPDPLGSQGALVLGRWHRLLFAVNAGSNDISVFEVQGFRLRLLDKEPSWGQMPVSIAVHGRLVYVLNAGGTPNIQGFVITPFGGRLFHLPHSGRNLPGGAASAAAEVDFSPDGNVLMVAEKGTNKLDTWSVNDFGYAENGMATDSSGATPFGFTFVHQFAIVSEAGPSALSSYEVDSDGTLELKTASLGDTQAANCWVVATRNGRYAYTTNTGTGTISSYLVARDGSLTLLNAVAGNTGAGTAPIDMALSNDSRFLYVRDGVKGMVDGFKVNADGSLTPVGSAGGIPAGAQGLAAR